MNLITARRTASRAVPSSAVRRRPLGADLRAFAALDAGVASTPPTGAVAVRSTAP
ncbi:hypothetical protein [Micromonospora sp. WMMD1082]|uniref:hypothetical protein n=1 Tax=Micromonospora sp. WMMD1082 TaxID=3016104 RepID=UPI002416F8FA|nr:hypothetical protein [Micromonospora sp. WMMD1082]MDG4795693.1 hypothetical protein [Micromonospora sp. WMMD1082]